MSKAFTETRSISTVIKYYIHVIFALFLILSCCERPKENPFEPESDVPAPVDLMLEFLNNKVKLYWNTKDITDFKGYRLYKAIDSKDNISLLTELPAETKTFTDTSLQYYHWYFYRVSVLGYDVESKPSSYVKIYPGPSQVWILSQMGYSIHQYSHDIQHKRNIYNTQSPPTNWDLNHDQKQIWLTYAYSSSIGKVDLQTGYVDGYSLVNFTKPVDIKWDNLKKRSVILDQSKRMIFFFDGQSIVDSLALNSGSYFKLQLSSNSDIGALSDSNAIIYLVDSNTPRKISFDDGYVGQDLIFCDNNLYILTANSSTGQSIIIKYDIRNNEQEELIINGIFKQVRKIVNCDYFWIIEKTEQYYKCVKLSETGERLIEIASLISVTDIQINPFDQSLIVVERYNDRILLFDSLGKNISENSQVYDPIKVLIQ